MVIQIIPLDSSEPNVIELERVYVALVITSDGEHDASLCVYIHCVYVELSKMDGVNNPKI
jgi:hypothetical protein